MASTKTYVIDSGMNGFGMEYPNNAEINKLLITHNAGFFSCNTIALQDAYIFARAKKQPFYIDRHSQYLHYKNEPAQSLISHYFRHNDDEVWQPGIELTDLSLDNRTELQYSDYNKLVHEQALPFMEKYFTPSDYVMQKVSQLEHKYNIDYNKTVSVLYRGNDKNRETRIAPYSEFITQAQQLNDSLWKTKGLADAAGMRYLVQPDECEFWTAFNQSVPNSFRFDETPCLNRQDSAMFFELPIAERAEFGANFMAAMIVISRCKYLITHSGNCGLWAVLYRGHSDNVKQWQNDKWI